MITPRTPATIAQSIVKKFPLDTLTSRGYARYTEAVQAGIDETLAELCPPNHLLLSAEVVREHDPGMNTPDAFEHAYDYAAIRDFVVLTDSLDEQHAGLIVFAAEQADIAPDGLGTLENQISSRFADQAEALIRKAAALKANPFTFPVFTTKQPK